MNHYVKILLILFLLLGLSGQVFAVTIGTPVLISKSTAGVIGNFTSGDNISSSLDGRYIVFDSQSSNLVSGDTNSTRDIFLRDTQSGTTTRISISSGGTEANNSSSYPSISSDGRYIVFQSDATNLVAGDTNNATDVFLRDTQTDTTTRISLNASGGQVLGESTFPYISANGQYVSFNSQSSQLVSGDTNGNYDFFVRDLQAGTTTLVSVNTGGILGNAASYGNSSISSDGRYIVFESQADNLVAGDTNTFTDVFLRDTQLNTTTRISVSSAGAEGDDESQSRPLISSDGRYIAFDSNATNLVSGDTNGSSDIFLRDTQLNTTTRISVSSAGVQSDSGTGSIGMSANGRYISFAGGSTNLVTGDTNGAYDVFLYDTQDATTTRASITYLGGQANDGSYASFISPDGSYLLYSSDATNIVSGDTNNSTDTFLVSIIAPILTPTISTTSSSSITTTTATLTGNITATGGEANTERGFNIGTDNTYTMPDVEDVAGSYSTGSYSLTATGLTCGTMYHYRAYSTNTSGTGTGSDDTFTTSACPNQDPEPSGSSSSGSSAGGRANNLYAMGKIQEAKDIVAQFPNAINEIKNENIKKELSSNIPSFTKSLKKGKVNPIVQVMQLQKVLGLKDDGKFGPKTEKAVKEFQKKNGLMVDGIVGPKTWELIIKHE